MLPPLRTRALQAFERGLVGPLIRKGRQADEVLARYWPLRCPSVRRVTRNLSAADFSQAMRSTLADPWTLPIDQLLPELPPSPPPLPDSLRNAPLLAKRRSSVAYGYLAPYVALKP
jgi:hypothetical protein